jgi:hypothetical protein
MLESEPGIEGALIAEDGSILATTGMPSLSDLPDGAYSALPCL